jgi:hypothetical protein
MQENALFVRVALLSLAGGCIEGVVLSWAIERQKTAGPGGWWSHTLSEWKEDLSLTRRQIERSRQRLRDLGVLEEVRRGIPARLFYRVDTDRVDDLLGDVNG